MTKRGIALLALYGASCLLLWGCAGPGERKTTGDAAIRDGEDPEAIIQSLGGITLGEPTAVTLDFDGNPLVANGIPGSVVRLVIPSETGVEFQPPRSNPGFYPADLEPTGFFVYVIDEVQRLLLRFYKTGAYLDVLIDFDQVFEGRRFSPVGLAVDGSGRIAVSDVKNHTITVFDTYLSVELVFGSYGRFPGQFDSPEGVFFTRKSELLVTDSGNRRVQFFDADGGFVRAVPADSVANPLRRPRRAVMDGSGHIYVADPAAGQVFVFDQTGEWVRSIVPRGANRFVPTDVAVSPSGLIYVTDSASSSLYLFR